MQAKDKRFSLPRIEKIPAEVRATDALRALIIEGRLPASSRVTETQLSQEMGLSRATIRTALHQLAQEGLLKLVPYTGWAVIDLTVEDVWELYTLRSAMERLAAQLAATAADPKLLDPVKAAYATLEQAVKSGQAPDIAEADFAFHKAIVDAAFNRRLSIQYAMIEQQIRVYIRSSDSLVAAPGDIIAQHKPMFDAIVSGNGDEAGRLAEEHNLQEGKKLATSALIAK